MKLPTRVVERFDEARDIVLKMLRGSGEVIVIPDGEINRFGYSIYSNGNLKHRCGEPNCFIRVYGLATANDVAECYKKVHPKVKAREAVLDVTRRLMDYVHYGYRKDIRKSSK